MKPNTELYSAMLLNELRGLKSSQCHRLLAHFGGFERALQASFGLWESDGIISSEDAVKIKGDIKRAQDQVGLDLEWVSKNNISVYCFGEERYPELLNHIHDPPILLFCKGKPLLNESVPIAIVGSRRPTYYGQKVAKVLTEELVRAGVLTVSGLARGIDSIVHQETVAQDGITWAVLGCGLYHLYPPENRQLAEKISETGSIITEFPPTMRPFPGNFPRRNRIIAGLTQGTMIVEGHKKSGALITAKLAADQGRDVFAVPGPITSDLSEGPHALIRDGAKIVETAQDVLEEFSLSTVHKNEKEAPESNPAHQKILDELKSIPILKEELAKQLNLSPHDLSSIIFELEMKGQVKTEPGGLLVKI